MNKWRREHHMQRSPGSRPLLGRRPLISAAACIFVPFIAYLSHHVPLTFTQPQSHSSPPALTWDVSHCWSQCGVPVALPVGEEGGVVISTYANEGNKTEVKRSYRRTQKEKTGWCFFLPLKCLLLFISCKAWLTKPFYRKVTLVWFHWNIFCDEKKIGVRDIKEWYFLLISLKLSWISLDPLV